jgi:hypothetical protein
MNPGDARVKLAGRNALVSAGSKEYVPHSCIGLQGCRGSCTPPTPPHPPPQKKKHLRLDYSNVHCEILPAVGLDNPSICFASTAARFQSAACVQHQQARGILECAKQRCELDVARQLRPGQQQSPLLQMVPRLANEHLLQCRRPPRCERKRLQSSHYLRQPRDQLHFEDHILGVARQG